MSAPLRAAGVEIEPVADGYVVFHRARHRVHYLNHTGALVLELCTGENEPQDIALSLQRSYDLPEPPAAEVQSCLEHLRKEGLVA